MIMSRAAFEFFQYFFLWMVLCRSFYGWISGNPGFDQNAAKEKVKKDRLI